MIDIRLKFEVYDYTTHTLTEVLETGRPRYFHNVISGQVGYNTIIGNGSSAISALPFAEEIVIQSSSNVDLEDLRITGNMIKILNTGSSAIIVQTGTTGSPTYENIGIKCTVKAMFDGSYWRVEDGCQIGDFKWWNKNLSSTAGVLPWGWAECDGSTLSDSESPYNGETLPDLLTDDRFIRAGSTSGTEQEDAFQGHWHDLVIQNGSGAEEIPEGDYQRASNNRPTDSAVDLYTCVKSVQDAISDGSNGTPRTASETRPINITMVPLVKVK